MMKPIELINSLRKTDEYIEVIFLNGGCYKFHLFLKDMFPDAIPYINKERGHIITRIGDCFYDITGHVPGGNYKKLDWIDSAMAVEWSFHKNYRLKITECPACEEPIGI